LLPKGTGIDRVCGRSERQGRSYDTEGSQEKKNPNEGLIREVILEDLPLFEMLATNGKSKSEREK